MLIDASNFLRFPPHPGSIFLIDSLRSLQDPSFFFLKTERNTSSPFFLAGLIQTPSLGHSGSLSSQVARSGWSPHLVLSLSLSLPLDKSWPPSVSKGSQRGHRKHWRLGWAGGQEKSTYLFGFGRVWRRSPSKVAGVKGERLFEDWDYILLLWWWAQPSGAPIDLPSSTASGCSVAGDFMHFMSSTIRAVLLNFRVLQALPAVLMGLFKPNTITAQAQ